VTLAHTRDDLMRAALTGVAGLLRRWLDDLRAVGCGPEKVMLGGGGSRHPAWRDLLKAELGLPLYPADTPWLTARGAAMLAAGIAGND
jgi:xylulokinase